MTTNDILRDLLQQSGLTKADFSRKTDTPQPRISEWINDKERIKLDRLFTIAKRIGFEIKIEVVNNN